VGRPRRPRPPTGTGRDGGVLPRGGAPGPALACHRRRRPPPRSAGSARCARGCRRYGGRGARRAGGTARRALTRDMSGRPFLDPIVARLPRPAVDPGHDSERGPAVDLGCGFTPNPASESGSTVAPPVSGEAFVAQAAPELHGTRGADPARPARGQLDSDCLSPQETMQPVSGPDSWGRTPPAVMSILRSAILAIAAFVIIVACFVGFFLFEQAMAAPPVPLCVWSGGVVLPGQTPMATPAPGACVHGTP
jgi:hypothetical protein